MQTRTETWTGIFSHHVEVVYCTLSWARLAGLLMRIEVQGKSDSHITQFYRIKGGGGSGRPPTDNF